MLEHTVQYGDYLRHHIGGIRHPSQPTGSAASSATAADALTIEVLRVFSNALWMAFIAVVNPRDPVVSALIVLSEIFSAIASPLMFSNSLASNGAPGRNRTCDLALRRHSLYPLSYRGQEIKAGSGASGLKWWWRRRGSNPRPSHCERDALPTELLPLKRAANSSSNGRPSQSIADKRV
jgi:hypothetical protein